MTLAALMRGGLKLLAKVAVLLVVLAGVSAMLWGPDRALEFVLRRGAKAGGSEEDIALFTVRRQDLQIGLTEYGSLRATKNVKVRCELARDARFAWLAPEGAIVEAGEVIARFERQSYEDRMKSLEDQLLSLKEEEEITRQNLEIVQSEVKSLEARSETRLDEALEDLRRYQEIEAPDRRKELRDNINKARERHDDAKTALSEAQQKLFEAEEDADRAKAQKDVETAQAAVETAEKQVDAAWQVYKDFRSQSYPRTLKNKEDNVANLRLELDKARISSRRRVDQEETRLRSLPTRISKTEDEIQEMRSNLESCEVRAPVAGRVLYGDSDVRWSRDRVQVGQGFPRGYAFMTIPDESAFEIDVYVAEEYRYRLSVGDRALITVEAITDLSVIEGRVLVIDNFAESHDGGPKAYKTVISMPKADPRMTSGMTARVEIICETVPDALVVPVEAVFNVDGEPVCYVQADEALFKRTVKPGKSSDHFVEILEGLAEGELVALRSPVGAGESEPSDAAEETARPRPETSQAAPVSTREDRRGAGRGPNSTRRRSTSGAF